MPSESQIWVSITTKPTNLSFSTSLSLNGDRWDVSFTNNAIRATSRKAYPIPSTGFGEDFRRVEHLMNQVVGHLRNVSCFSLGLGMKWGYEGGYTGTRVGESASIFPSIHQNGSSRYPDQTIELDTRILEDISSSRRKGVKSLLNYWRRANELDDLGFDSEAYLNYYKVIECLSELNTDQNTKRAIVERFAPNKVPQKTLCKRYGIKTEDKKRNLYRQIYFVAKAFSAANISAGLRRGLFIKVLDIVYMRHGWNIAHKLLRPSPYDTYDAIGQHSDEFSLVMIENIYIEEITKLMILRYIKPGQYEFRPNGNLPIVLPVSGKGSTFQPLGSIQT